MSNSIYTPIEDSANKKIYTRECPSCQIVIEHDSKTMRDHYQKNNTLCESCKTKKIPENEAVKEIIPVI
jgi:hypothetical protein